jgi:hypothetical protein
VNTHAPATSPSQYNVSASARMRRKKPSRSVSAMPGSAAVRGIIARMECLISVSAITAHRSGTA